MRRSGLVSRWRIIFAGLIMAAAIGAATTVPMSSTEAAPAGNCTYYSDATRTTVVGKFGKDCCNNVIAWGTRTSFFQCGGCFICTPPPPR
jgi:hypothetical protein